MKINLFEKRFYLILLIGMGTLILANAQTDSLILKNKNIIIGEIKSMDKGVLIIETDYSDVDFNITWDGIEQVFSKTKYLITLSNGKRYNGIIRSIDENTVEIDTYDPEGLLNIRKVKNSKTEDIGGGKINVQIMEIVYLNALDEGFWSRLSANIDLGWSVTKANNLRQFNVRSGLGYLADRWKITSSYNNINSRQDDTEDVNNLNANITYNYFLSNDWYLMYNISFLSNTEQLIKLRTNNQVGFGKYLIHNNKTYLGLQAGINLNNEKDFGDNPVKQSGEFFIGYELNMYDIGDFSIYSQLMAYPSFTESKRFRTDSSIDLKYEFFSDFYVKLGTSVNYDNRPVVGGTKLTYVIQTTIGWSL